MSGLEGLLAGRELGDRYRIEEVIGRGGMGAVYRATDARLGRQVAVKVITISGGADADARERLRARFYREARAAAALPHHPNVVPVYDYGSDPTLGLDYIVMELLRGSDLASRLARSGPPPLAGAMRVLYEAARGVAVGHRAGLIHRDVKPGNIFLAESEGDEVQVRILDFGIAKLADDEDTYNQLTQDGRVPHSPAFASPEQLRGLGNLKPASDVFSLGAVGFTLLTGQRPFSESDRNRMSLGMPVPPASVRNVNPAIPSPIEIIVQKALSHEPEDRYPDAGEMAKALGQALRGLSDTPVEPYGVAGLTPPQEHPAEDDRTRLMEPEDDRTLLAPEGSREAPGPVRPAPPPPRSRAFPPRREEPRGGRGGKLVWLLLVAVLAAAGYLILFQADGGAPTAGREEIPPPPDTLPDLTAETTVEDTMDAQPELQAFVVNDEGLGYFRAGDYAAAAERFRLATELVPDNADYAYNHGLALLRLGNPAAAADALRRATRLDSGRTGAFYNLGVAQLAAGDTVGAWSSLQRALDLAQTPAERAAALREIRAIERAEAAEPRQEPADTIRAIPMDTIRRDPAPAGRPPAPRDTLAAGRL